MMLTYRLVSPPTEIYALKELVGGDTIAVRKIYGDFLYNILLAFCGLPPHKITML
jgi:hypothetical protein